VTLVIPAEEKRFAPDAFLANIARGRAIESFRKNQTVFAQGTSCDSVLYIQKGKVKLTKKPRQKWWARLDRGSATL
jgi:CRP-like cAMP-binding protein